MDLIEFTTKEGTRILRNLYSYSYNRYRFLYNREVNERGKSFKDYVSDAIEKYHSMKDNLYITQADHEMFLKSLIKQSLYNDLLPYQRKERKAFKEPLEESNLITYQTQNTEDILKNFPVIDSSELDRNIILEKIENALGGDEVVKTIYTAVCIKDFSLSNRIGICEEFGLSIDDFNNGIRRFMRIVKKIINQKD